MLVPWSDRVGIAEIRQRLVEEKGKDKDQQSSGNDRVRMEFFQKPHRYKVQINR